MSEQNGPDASSRPPRGDPDPHVVDLVVPYALGALEPDERAHVERHRRACPACDNLLRDERRFVSLLPLAARATAPPPPDVKIALFARVAHAQRATADASPVALADHPLTPTSTIPTARAIPTATRWRRPPGRDQTRRPLPLPAWGTRWATALLVFPLLLALAGTGTWAFQLRAKADDSGERVNRFNALFEATLAEVGTDVPLLEGPDADKADASVIADDERLTAVLVMRHNDPAAPRRYRLVATLDGKTRLVATVELDDRGRGLAPFTLIRPLAAYTNLRLKIDAPVPGSTDPDVTGLVLRAAPATPNPSLVP